LKEKAMALTKKEHLGGTTGEGKGAESRKKIRDPWRKGRRSESVLMLGARKKETDLQENGE